MTEIDTGATSQPQQENVSKTVSTSRQLQVHINHSSSDIIGSIDERTTRGIKKNYQEMIQYSFFYEDKFWYEVCHEELEQFTMLHV